MFWSAFSSKYMTRKIVFSTIIVTLFSHIYHVRKHGFLFYHFFKTDNTNKKEDVIEKEPVKEVIEKKNEYLEALKYEEPFNDLKSKDDPDEMRIIPSSYVKSLLDDLRGRAPNPHDPPPPTNTDRSKRDLEYLASLKEDLRAEDSKSILNLDKERLKTEGFKKMLFVDTLKYFGMWPDLSFSNIFGSIFKFCFKGAAEAVTPYFRIEQGGKMDRFLKFTKRKYSEGRDKISLFKNRVANVASSSCQSIISYCTSGKQKLYNAWSNVLVYSQKSYLFLRMKLSNGWSYLLTFLPNTHETFSESVVDDNNCSKNATLVQHNKADAKNTNKEGQILESCLQKPDYVFDLVRSPNGEDVIYIKTESDTNPNMQRTRLSIFQNYLINLVSPIFGFFNYYKNKFIGYFYEQENECEKNEGGVSIHEVSNEDEDSFKTASDIRSNSDSTQDYESASSFNKDDIMTNENLIDKNSASYSSGSNAKVIELGDKKDETKQKVTNVDENGGEAHLSSEESETFYSAEE